jgi:hypothetical protein
MAICKTCGTKYSKWTTPVSARGLCADCFESKLNNEREVTSEEDLSALEMVPMEKPKARIRLTSFIPRSRSTVVFVLAMSCYCVTLSYFVVAWARVAHIQGPPRAWYLSGGTAEVIGLLVVGPFIESLILVGVFELVRRVRAPETVQVLVAALFVSEAHAWPWWPHAIIVLPSFCIQAASYLYWRRESWKVAFWVVASIHALNNVIPAVSTIAYAMRHA